MKVFAVVLIVVMGILAGCGTRTAPTTPIPPEGVTTPLSDTTAPTPTAAFANDLPATVTGGFVGDEQAYITFILDTTDAYAQAFRTFGELNQRAGQDTELLVDADWVREAQAATVDIETISQQVLDYEGVPDRFATVHARLVEAADKYKTAMPLYREGLDTFDMESLTRAVTLVVEATGIVQEVTQAVADLVKQ